MTTPVTVLERIEVMMDKHFMTIESMLEHFNREIYADAIISAYNQGYEKGKRETDAEETV